MSRRQYQVDFRRYRKLIVGEGEADRNFLAEFCRKHAIDGFDYAFTGMHGLTNKYGDPIYIPSGFGVFQRYLSSLGIQTNFQAVTDIVLVYDSATNRDVQFTKLCTQIDDSRTFVSGKEFRFNKPLSTNQVTTGNPLRLHAFSMPPNSAGGIETICLQAAVDRVGANGVSTLEKVDRFADEVCSGWNEEKRDKLRLQAFLSAHHQDKPDIHFSQIFDLTKDELIPLDGPAFEPLRTFLTTIAALEA